MGKDKRKPNKGRKKKKKKNGKQKTLWMVSSLVPTHQYLPTEIEGWRVLVNARLVPGGDQCSVGENALKLLQSRLWEISLLPSTGVLSEANLKLLRRVPIWLGVNDGSGGNAMEYHPSSQWLRENGYNPDKAQCVEIGSAERFFKCAIFEQPGCVLHELSHAFHDQFMSNGFDNPAIKQAYERVVEAGYLGGQILHRIGTREEAYALTNQMEWWAEMCETYFNMGDFWPFTFEELKQMDPQSAQLLQTIWQQ